MVNYTFDEGLKFAASICPECGNETFIRLTAKEIAGMKKVRARKMTITEALPNRTRSVREAFIGGMCAECWNKYFPNFTEDGSYLSIDNKSDEQPEYLVAFTPYEEDGEDGCIAVRVSAADAFTAINEAVESTVGYRNLPVARIIEYNDAIEAGCKLGEVYKLPCDYVVEKTHVTVAKLINEEVRV